MQVVLRKLFERLGATYIKLGQFIASAPSLFPAEYVTEFQACPAAGPYAVSFFNHKLGSSNSRNQATSPAARICMGQRGKPCWCAARLHPSADADVDLISAGLWHVGLPVPCQVCDRVPGTPSRGLFGVERFLAGRCDCLRCLYFPQASSPSTGSTPKP